MESKFTKLQTTKNTHNFSHSNNFELDTIPDYNPPTQNELMQW